MLVLRCNAALDRLGATPEAPEPRTSAVAAASAPDPGRVLQIVAHPDDDLYFMNPDLRYSISAGLPVTSVYLTSGEADGINAGAAKLASTRADKPAYAEARQNGIRAAYAKMATGDRGSAWKRTVVTTKGGGRAEVDVLVAKPQVNLVWLQLREAGNVYEDVPESLRGLWNGKVPRLESMLASGTPVKEKYAYTKEQVVQTLVGVLEHYKPTTIRSQDPTPGRFPDTKRYTDHQDHFYGARFVQAATAAYAKDVKDRPHFAVQNYIGYFNGSLPSALDPGEAKEKLDILDTYAWLDRQNHCNSPAGCGDLKVADHPAGNRWTDSINYARGTSTACGPSRCSTARSPSGTGPGRSARGPGRPCSPEPGWTRAFRPSPSRTGGSRPSAPGPPSAHGRRTTAARSSTPSRRAPAPRSSGNGSRWAPPRPRTRTGPPTSAPRPCRWTAPASSRRTSATARTPCAGGRSCRTAAGAPGSGTAAPTCTAPRPPRPTGPGGGWCSPAPPSR
jgi:LmbE family N-acetylglucosaminyl deacetylase